MSRYILARGGESSFHIVTHQYADETVRYAASELQKYLLKATGAVLPYFSDRCPLRGPEIRLGASVRGETAEESDLHEEGFRIRGMGEHITVTAKTSRGILYGVYRFLEIFCNFRKFTPEAETIDCTDRLEIELTEITEEPAFDFRDAYFRRAFDGDFCAKNRLNSSLADLSKATGGRMKWFNFHHSFNDLVPETEYFAPHPEYYSEIDGKRTQNRQLCLTNPEVVKIAEQTLRRWIRENPECTVFSVAQNDNRRRCTCPACRALEEAEGSPAGPILHFVNQLADAIREDYPHVLLHTFAYQYSLPAPKHVVARDNVIVRICSISCRFDRPFAISAKEDPDGEEALFLNALRDWETHANLRYVWDYAVNFRNYPQPFLHFHTMAENLRFFRRIGIRGILEQGNFAYGGGVAMDDLKGYLIGRLLWNPDTDTDEEIHRFCVGVYGAKAAPCLEEYLRLAEHACSSAPLTIYQNPDAKYLSDDWIEQGDRLFRKAMALATEECHRRAIEREYCSLRYLQLCRSALDAPGRAEAIEEFFRDLKAFGITEIRERRSLAVSKNSMLNSRYATDRTGEYSLYYIMQ